MAIASGSRIGPYEVISLLGSGGMGEVYLGRDSRIGRNVAIKVLPSLYAQNPDRLRRFEQEAQAAGTLNHPNILVIYDLGTQEGSPYLICEYLEGETLRQRMRGALSQRRAVEYAKQIATGLAAAHEKGIVHRDLKPENIFITKDERVKILDFGLAKLIEPQGGENRSLIPTSPPATEAGMVIGTVGYMSPEQVKGLVADPRSDIFAFGAILYEMLTGKRAFHGDSPVETMSAILKEDPPEVGESVVGLSPALDRILRHCLEKNPEARFQSARDLAFDLETISASSGTANVSKVETTKGRNLYKHAAALLGLLAVLAGVFWSGQKFTAKPSIGMSLPDFHRLTFSRGTVQSARFVQDGNSIVYSASWRGAKTPQLYDVRRDAVESRSLGISDARVLSISKTGQMALLTKKGILAQAPLSGGALRELMENVINADWDPDGKDLVVVREVSGKRRIEYPIGKVIYETAEWISYVRFSPNGKWIAFSLHPVPADNGKLVIIDSTGKKKTETKQWFPTSIAWRPDGNEVWFSTWSLEQAGGFYLNGLTVDGKERVLFRFPVYFTLLDISLDGAVLVTAEEVRKSIHGFLPGDAKERDYSWLDYSGLNDISKDGKILLLSESGEGGDEAPVTYFRRTNEESAVKLGKSVGHCISSDSKYVLGAFPFGIFPVNKRGIFVVPIGPGNGKEFALDSFEGIASAEWMPGEKEVLFSGRQKGHRPRLYLMNLSDSSYRPISPEGTFIKGWSGHVLSPNGKWVVVTNLNDNEYSLWPIQGGEARRLDAIASEEVIFQWSPDGHSVYTFKREELPARIFSVDVLTGQRKLIRELLPDDATGVTSILSIRFLPDGQHYVYDFDINLASLYLMKGLK